MDKLLDFHGRAVFVAGGSSGINLGIADAFASRGAKVAVMSRSQDRIAAATEHLRRHGGTVCGIAGDVRDPAAVAEALKTAHEQFGDFELEMDWKIGSGGNSGIFYRGTEEESHIYWTAPEYQLLDDVTAADNVTRLTCAGSAYALYPSPAGHLEPARVRGGARSGHRPALGRGG